MRNAEVEIAAAGNDEAADSDSLKHGQGCAGAVAVSLSSTIVERTLATTGAYEDSTIITTLFFGHISSMRIIILYTTHCLTTYNLSEAN